MARPQDARLTPIAVTSSGFVVCRNDDAASSSAWPLAVGCGPIRPISVEEARELADLLQECADKIDPEGSDEESSPPSPSEPQGHWDEEINRLEEKAI